MRCTLPCCHNARAGDRKAFQALVSMYMSTTKPRLSIFKPVVCSPHPPILPTLSSFVPSVSALYDVSLNTSDYYDISTNSTEINHLTDMPFGFFQYHLNGEGGGERQKNGQDMDGGQPPWPIPPP